MIPPPSSTSLVQAIDADDGFGETALSLSVIVDAGDLTETLLSAGATVTDEAFWRMFENVTAAAGVAPEAEAVGQLTAFLDRFAEGRSVTHPPVSRGNAIVRPVECVCVCARTCVYE